MQVDRMITAYDALRELVPIIQFKKVKNTHREVLLLVKLQALAMGVLCFLNCTKETKSRKPSHMMGTLIDNGLKINV